MNNFHEEITLKPGPNYEGCSKTNYTHGWSISDDALILILSWVLCGHGNIGWYVNAMPAPKPVMTILIGLCSFGQNPRFSIIWTGFNKMYLTVNTRIVSPVWELNSIRVMSSSCEDDCEMNFRGRMGSISSRKILYHAVTYSAGTSLKRLLVDVWLKTLRFATVEWQKAASENEYSFFN